jgi:hypothetical protein
MIVECLCVDDIVFDFSTKSTWSKDEWKLIKEGEAYFERKLTGEERLALIRCANAIRMPSRSV